MQNKSKRSLYNNEIHKIPKSIIKPVGKAVTEFNMIQEGDNLLLGLSGGKDSLSLLHILRHLQRHAPINFSISAITVDPEIEGFEPSRLKDYLAELNVPYFFESHDMTKQAEEHMQKDSFCSFCSRMKRGIMYSVARREKCNVLVLGQHLDDLAESFLMSAFQGGQLRTMKANYINQDGDLRIIRPMIYVREHQLTEFSKEKSLPVIPDSCPACFDMPTEREHVKQLLAKEETHNKGLFKSLRTALKPLYSRNDAG
ncbi:MAG: tRNA 2-thiocytidine biosynthesis protein TtcA [Gammaproteobacteria bacterium]|nr:tRNA 2-thiocytidine biosynthesis protein TtcA [Gammaproteobacteria bacterium]